MSYLKGAQLFRKLYSSVSLFSKPKLKNNYLYVVEPLSAMVRIALLNYKEIGTKISISNNRISYSDPNMLQGTIRWSYGDNRNDLHHLLYPIRKAVEWFPPSELENAKIIFSVTRLGLQRLKETYKKTNEAHLVCHSLDLYTSIIDKSLSSKSDTFEDDESDDYDDENAICKALRHIWLISQIELISKLLIQIEDDRGNTSHYLDAIENILSVIEDRVNRVVLNLHSYEEPTDI